MLMMDGYPYPIPPCPDCFPHLGPIESFFVLFLCSWFLFFFLLSVLPEPWIDAIWRVAFPFAPRRKPE